MKEESSNNISSSTVDLYDPRIQPDEQEYDPYQHRNVEHPNTFFGALTHLLKSSLGSGILAIPSAIAATGVLVGAVGTVLTGFLCAYTVYLLVASSQRVCRRIKVPSLGFAETAHAVCKYGPKKLQPWANFASVWVDVSLLLTYYATIAVYVVFVSSSIRELVKYYTSEETWSIRYYMVVPLVLLIVLCQIRELKYLVPFSFVANTTMIIAFGITLYYMCSGIGDVNIEDRRLATDFSGVPLFFSTVLFAMEGIGTNLPIENSMLKQQFLGTCGVLNIAMSTVTTLYTIIGIFGYLRFGDEVEANIVANLPDEDVQAQVAKVCITVTVLFTSLLQFYVPSSITWEKLSPRIPQKYHNIAQILMRALFVLIITGIAAAVPKLSSIISLVGSICLSNLGLFVPATMDIILDLGDGDFGFLKWKLWSNILIIILSFFALVSGSYYAINDLIED